jgi:hypothetical protein
MSVWLWVVVGIAGFFAVSIVIGLALAAVLGQISRGLSEALDLELWASAPMTRGSTAAEAEPSHEEPAKQQQEPAVTDTAALTN